MPWPGCPRDGFRACLSAQSAKLYHMGFRGPVRRSTLADANETRDWRIYAEFAQRLIAQARRLYAGDDLDVDLPSTVYSLDSTTIDLCLWCSTKAAVKMHTLLDLRGNIPSFIHTLYLMASCTTFTRSICCSPSLAPSMSWIGDLRKSHYLILCGAGQRPHCAVAIVARDNPVERAPWQEVHELRE
jgi:hypothetical protein